MLYFIFLICVVTHSIDSAVGKSDLKQHWKDISFELISNLSEESSEGNKRSKISEDSLELSNESGSNISFESEESESNESDLSNRVDSSYSKEVDVRTIDNDEVFCSWEDVDARDEMATKLKTELCRFSMVCINFYTFFVKSKKKIFSVS